MTARRTLTLFTALGATAFALATAAIGGSFNPTAVGPDLKQLEDVNFIVVCPLSHRRPHDPIVHPGHPGASHDHSFFGSVATDAFSTPRSLRSEATTCDRAEDTAAYWTPTLLQDSRVVEAVDAWAYYHRRTLAKVHAFPPGLQMIAGNAGAAQAQSTRIVFWDCGEKGGIAPSARVPTCPPGDATSLRLNVRFPDCWDGRRLDSPNHYAHMAYSARGVCPSSHPVEVPSVTLVVQYPTRGGADVALASIGQLSGHADFVNSWQQAGLRRLVDYCLNALRACGHAPA